MTANHGELWSRFERMCRYCHVEIDKAQDRWNITFQRDGSPPIASSGASLPDAVAEAVDAAEAMGWHRSPEPPIG